MGRGNVLIADDDAAIRTVVNQTLARAGYSPRATGNAATLWNWVAQGEGDVVITDAMSNENALDLIPRIKEIRPEIPIIVMSIHNTFMAGITAARRGAFDYLPKPLDLKDLIAVVGRALGESKIAASSTRPEAEGENLLLVGRSAPMQGVYRIMARLLRTDTPALITGEPGTGKELLARTLHDYGHRRKGPFVAVYMSAIPRELIETELFGYEGGSVASAVSRTVGCFERAKGGTLFLDEIGNMPLEAQTRFLRLLQEGEYIPAGGRVPVKIDVRILAATSMSLETRIALGLFREDLYCRLNAVPFRMPPLRDRLDDIPDLVHHFLTLAEKSGLPRKALTEEAFERMNCHRWPGNVREIESLVRRLSALYPQETISADIIENELRMVPSPPSEGNSSAPAKLNELIEAYFTDYFQAFGDRLPPDGLYDRTLREVETPLITAALTATHGNQIKAAKLLGLNRNTIRKKVREQKIKLVRTH
jgi:two-component system, NtrC family, nitrogen regulation response regulator GlnG